MATWIKPAPGAISSKFGPRTSPGGIGSSNHLGTDIGCPVGTAVEASEAGIVTYAGLLGGFGALVIIDHGGWHTTRYAHLSEIHVTVGQHVAQRQRIGLSGGKRGAWGAGTSTGAHLHTEHRFQGVPTDPEPHWAATAALASKPIPKRKSRAMDYTLVQAPGLGAFMIRSSDGAVRSILGVELAAQKAAGIECATVATDALALHIKLFGYQKK